MQVMIPRPRPAGWQSELRQRPGPLVTTRAAGADVEFLVEVRRRDVELVRVDAYDGSVLGV